MSLIRRVFPSVRFTSEFSKSIKQVTGVRPRNTAIYTMALRHSSAAKNKEHKLPNDNQRLEFLGDAILGAVVAQYLYEKFPEKDEGYLTNLRSKIVSRKSLNAIAVNIGIQKLLQKKLDKTKPVHSIYGDAFEALIGAIYLDRGLKKTEWFIREKIIHPYWDENRLRKHVISYKSVLIEWAQKEKKNVEFKLLDTWGKKHALNFKVSLEVAGEELCSGKGTSIKRAEESAAQIAYQKLGLT